MHTTYTHAACACMTCAKHGNDFVSLSWPDVLLPDGELEWHVQIHAKLYPEYATRSHAQANYQLQKTLGAHLITIIRLIETNAE